MGVFGLLGHCLSHKDRCVNYVDLVTVASRQDGGIELLCDFYCFEHLVVKAFWDGISRQTGNVPLRLIGGEYKSLHDYVSKLVNDLKSLGISLVMFVDSARGSTGRADWDRKFETWRQRFNEDIKRCWAVVDYFTGRRPVKEVVESQTIRPVLVDIQMLETLAQCGCEIVQCSEGEADGALANALHTRPRAFAIMSNDSDFCVFKNCRFIPHDLFDINNDLKFASAAASLLPSTPLRLVVGVIFVPKVAELFQFACQDDLVELSIITGNDFTRQFSRNLQRQMHLVTPGVSILNSAADWVRKNGKVENSPAVVQEMNCNQDFADAVRHTRQFYSGWSSQFHGGLSPLGMCLRDGVRSCHLSNHVMGMHQQFYWQRVIVEDLRCQSNIERCLSTLRSYVYRMVLDAHKTFVTECTRSDTGDLETIQVRAANERFLPPANVVSCSELQANASIFLQIMNHQEHNHAPVDWFMKYGFNDGFSCSVLRYLVVLMSSVNFDLSTDEFLALAATVLAPSSLDVNYYQRQCIVPGIRCITIGNWFLDIYRHAFSFIGKLLCLSDKFPNPKDCFSGAVLAAFYATAMHQLESTGRPLDMLERITGDFDGIVAVYHGMIRDVVDGYLPFVN